MQATQGLQLQRTVIDEASLLLFTQPPICRPIFGIVSNSLENFLRDFAQVHQYRFVRQPSFWVEFDPENGALKNCSLKIGNSSTSLKCILRRDHHLEIISSKDFDQSLSSKVSKTISTVLSIMMETLTLRIETINLPKDISTFTQSAAFDDPLQADLVDVLKGHRPVPNGDIPYQKGDRVLIKRSDNRVTVGEVFAIHQEKKKIAFKVGEGVDVNTPLVRWVSIKGAQQSVLYRHLPNQAGQASFYKLAINITHSDQIPDEKILACWERIKKEKQS